MNESWPAVLLQCSCPLTPVCILLRSKILKVEIHVNLSLSFVRQIQECQIGSDSCGSWSISRLKNIVISLPGAVRYLWFRVNSFCFQEIRILALCEILCFHTNVIHLFPGPSGLLLLPSAKFYWGHKHFHIFFKNKIKGCEEAYLLHLQDLMS